MNKALILLSFFLAPSYLSANTINPLRVDYEAFDQLRYNTDHGLDSYAKHGFKIGMIDDVFYNPVFVCTLTEIDSGASHKIAVTNANDVIKFYEYIDINSEGYYKLLSYGVLNLTTTDSEKAIYTDELGGQIKFNLGRKVTAQVDLKEPALSVNKKNPCY